MSALLFKGYMVSPEESNVTGNLGSKICEELEGPHWNWTPQKTTPIVPPKFLRRPVSSLALPFPPTLAADGIAQSKLSQKCLTYCT